MTECECQSISNYHNTIQYSTEQYNKVHTQTKNKNKKYARKINRLYCVHKTNIDNPINHLESILLFALKLS